MKRLLSILLFSFFIFSLWFSPKAYARAPQTPCNGSQPDFGGKKQYTPADVLHGRPGYCVKPKEIVLHITADNGLQDTLSFFNKGSQYSDPDGTVWGVTSHFLVDKDGSIYQLVPMYDGVVEDAYTVANYNDHISIELEAHDLIEGRDKLPQAQYQATLALVKKLMSQYHIPIGDHDENWISTINGQKSNAENSDVTAGIYSHHQLNPVDRTDPGDGLMRDLRQDIQTGGVVSPGNSGGTGTSVSNCFITKLGNPLTSPTPPSFCNLANGSGGSSQLLNVALDIKAAYGVCGKPPYSTNAGVGDCLVTELTKKGYDHNKLATFRSRYSGTVNGLSCTQCLGFVSLAVTLYSGQDISLGGAAISVNNVSQFASLANRVKQLDPSTPLQPGDIAVDTTGVDSGAGHIAFVKQTEGNIKFIGVESNYKACTATDNIEHNRTEFATYFRVQ